MSESLVWSKDEVRSHGFGPVCTECLKNKEEPKLYVDLSAVICAECLVKFLEKMNEKR